MEKDEKKIIEQHCAWRMGLNWRLAQTTVSLLITLCRLGQIQKWTTSIQLWLLWFSIPAHKSETLHMRKSEMPNPSHYALFISPSILLLFDITLALSVINKQNIDAGEIQTHSGNTYARTHTQYSIVSWIQFHKRKTQYFLMSSTFYK